jgi:ribosomal protein S18 acetylase RimI-like enzyme
MEPMPIIPELADGYVARPLSLDDAEAVADLLNAYAMALTGESETSARELRNEWTAPKWNPATDGLVVGAADGSLVAYADVWDTMDPVVRVYGWARVHPDHTGRGLGTALLDWTDRRLEPNVDRAPPGTRVSMISSTIAEDEAAHRLFEERGWEHVRSFYTMRIDFDGPPEPVGFPEEFTLRTVREGEDLTALAAAVEDSFADHWGHVRKDLDECVEHWDHWRETDEEHDPTLWFLLEDGDELAGMSICSLKDEGDPNRGWVHTLGVRRPWRRRGLGLALLRHSFFELHRRGQPGVGLGVDASSLTGATRLYEKAGMYVAREGHTFERVLREGKDLSTREV